MTYPDDCLDLEVHMKGLRDLVARLQKENGELRAEVRRLGDQNSTLCDEVYDTRAALASSEEAVVELQKMVDRAHAPLEVA